MLMVKVVEMVPLEGSAQDQNGTGFFQLEWVSC